jgi:hypothetical protein
MTTQNARVELEEDGLQSVSCFRHYIVIKYLQTKQNKVLSSLANIDSHGFDSHR